MATTTLESPRQRQRRNRTGYPHELVARLRREHPKAPADQIRRLYREHVLDLTAFNDPDVEGWVMVPLDAWLLINVRDPAAPREPGERAARAAEKEALVETIKRGHQRVVEAEAAVRLLEYVLPNGKTIGDCTGLQCQKLSRRHGSFFAELAKRITRGERVRVHLSEVELQEIARNHSVIGPGAYR